MSKVAGLRPRDGLFAVLVAVLGGTLFVKTCVPDDGIISGELNDEEKYVSGANVENQNWRDSTVSYQEAKKMLEDSLARVSSRLDSCESGKRCPVKKTPAPVKKPVQKTAPVKQPTPVEKPVVVNPAPAKPDAVVVTQVDDNEATKIVCPKNDGAVNVNVRDNTNSGDNNVVVNNGVIINNNNYDKDAVEVTQVVKRRIIVTYDRCR